MLVDPPQTKDLAHSSTAVSPPPFMPSAEQLVRVKKLKRYHWFTLYGPLVFMGLLILLFIIGGIWGATVGFGSIGINNQVEGWRTTISAMADLIVIFGALSGIVSCLILPAGAGAAWFYGRQKGWKPWQTTRYFLWRIDGWALKIQETVQKRAGQGADLMIQARSRLAYLENLWLWIRFLIIGR